MKSWKIWLITVSVICVLAVTTIGIAVWNNISSEWSVEAEAAQNALNHSPLNKLVSHDVFTGAGQQEVFYGYDVFGRPWYAFVNGNSYSVTSVPAQGILSKEQVQSLAESRYRVIVQNLHLGYLDSQTANTFQTQSHVVWEVYGHINQKPVYLYFDAYSGAMVWQPMYS